MEKSEFDEKARDWDTPDKIERSEEIAAVIRHQVALSEKWTAFEYGCGTGLLSFALQKYLGAITLADKSEGMLEVLREKIKKAGIKNWEVLDLDLLTEKLPEKKFDLVYTQLTLHHILDTKGIITRFYQLLKPGGFLCIADLDKEDGSFHGKEVINVHRGYDRTELGKLTRQVGFKDVNFVDAYRMVHPINESGDTAVFPVFLMTAQKSK